jgi:Xaa-Pro aminopeptidase
MAPVTDVVIYADTVRSPELRHELPLMIPDPILYLERNGSRHVVSSALELPRLRELAGLDVHSLEEFGFDELVKQGLDREQILREVATRAIQELGVERASVPAAFPLELADHLRANGIELAAEGELFKQRRRAKNEHELAGIRRAQKAAEAGMEAARGLLRRARDDGRTVTSEDVKRELDEQFIAHGCSADEVIVSHGPQSAIGHHLGEGPIGRDEPIVIDIWPRDRESGCYADMTRTFVIGEPSDELRDWHRLVKDALDRALAETRAGAAGRALYDGTCEIFEREGYPTQRTKEAGKPLEDGFFHGLGHGVGLEVHEDPSLGFTSKDELIAGDVVTLEPGLYRPGVGGCRLEDLVLVSVDGNENLTAFPYDLELR